MAVDFVGKDRQGPQADAVARFDDLQIVVGDGVVQDVGDAGPAPGGGPHPEDVVVAPLDVHPVVALQGV